MLYSREIVILPNDNYYFACMCVKQNVRVTSTRTHRHMQDLSFLKKQDNELFSMIS